MSPSFLSLVHWAFGALLEATVLFLALRHKLVQRLPFFVVYLVVLVGNELVFFAIYQTIGLTSEVFFYSYWSTQALFILLRALVVYELCRSIFSAFGGVWRFVKPILLTIGGVLLVAMLISMSGAPLNVKIAIPMGQRGLEVTIAGLLISGLAFCRYYRVQVEPYLAWIALGLGFHSIIQATADTFLPWLGHFALWAELSHASFDIALVMWVVALWSPLPALEHSRVLLAQDEYERLGPQVTTQLRELNTRLLEMWK